MTEILAELSRKMHEISLHSGNGDMEQDVAAYYAMQDALFDAESAAQLLGVAL